jgi:hypothetical protein
MNEKKLHLRFVRIGNDAQVESKIIQAYSETKAGNTIFTRLNLILQYAKCICRNGPKFIIMWCPLLLIIFGVLSEILHYSSCCGVKVPNTLLVSVLYLLQDIPIFIGLVNNNADRKQTSYLIQLVICHDFS